MCCAISGKYGHNLYIWDLAKKTIIQKLDLGVGSIPLEVRFLHDPDATEVSTVPFAAVFVINNQSLASCSAVQ